jgi:hypothetical protein
MVDFARETESLGNAVGSAVEEAGDQVARVEVEEAATLGSL